MKKDIATFDKKREDYPKEVDSVVQYREDWLFNTGLDYVGQSLVCDFASDYAEHKTQLLQKEVEQLKRELKNKFIQA